MRMFLISDNNDTLAGMRLSGVEGVVLHDGAEVAGKLDSLVSDGTVGVILITRKLMALVKDHVEETRKKHQTPLILEIPDRHG